MLKVGLTGGYATGKTFVAGELARLGCHLIFADQLGRAALEPDGAAYSQTLVEFGREILSPNHTIDRKKLASIVFGSPDRLARLNAIVHPAVFDMEERLLSKFAAQDPRGIAVLEAAILIETGRYKQCDALIVTACDPETQIVRGMERDGLTREDIMARLANQLSLEEKKRHADFVIETGGSKEDTVQQVEQVFGQLRRRAEGVAP